MLYLTRTPSIVQYLFPGFLWRSDATASQLYLTFDDGPIPEITPWVLDQLRQYGAKATFFCVGENVSKYPEIYERIVAEGHAVGNHTFNHISGRGYDPDTYLANVTSCAELVDSNLFRPPHGRLGRKQRKSLAGSNFRIVMWDVLSGDFDQDLDQEQCYRNVADNARPGSIIVFHDSLKAEHNMKYALPRVLHHFTKEGYHFAALKSEEFQDKARMQQVVA